MLYVGFTCFLHKYWGIKVTVSGSTQRSLVSKLRKSFLLLQVLVLTAALECEVSGTCWGVCTSGALLCLCIR